MPNWKKVVVSGSRAVLHDVTASNAMQGPEDFTIASTGKVGILQDSPASFTDPYDSLVVGNTDNASTGYGITIAAGGSSTESGIAFTDMTGGSRGRITYHQAHDKFLIGAGGNADQIQILSNGNVGIGGAPSNRLTVFGDFNVSSGDVIIADSQVVKNTNDNLKLQAGTSRDVLLALGSGTTGLKLDRAGDVEITNAVTASGYQGPGNFVVKSDGKVGINNNDPTYKLDVAGNAGINEYLYHNGDTNTYLRFQTDQTDIAAGGNALQITSTKISGSASSTGSFGRVEVKDNLIISGSNLTSTDNSLTVIGSGSAVFEVKGTNGTLFSVNDIMSGSIFSANTIAGIPVIEAFSDQKVTLGSPSAPVTITALSSSMDVSGSLRAVPKTDSLTGANNLDFSKNTNFRITITGNITLTPIGLDGRDGQSGIITLIQDGSGGHTISLNSTFKTPRGDSISFDTTANGVALMSYYVIDSTQVAVNYLGPFS
tara:strand:+ start:50 stop:1504 length:1455 start_codon:yes stop_codon:yes gene_type:complete